MELKEFLKMYSRIGKIAEEIAVEKNLDLTDILIRDDYIQFMFEDYNNMVKYKNLTLEEVESKLKEQSNESN